MPNKLHYLNCTSYGKYPHYKIELSTAFVTKILMEVKKIFYIRKGVTAYFSVTSPYVAGLVLNLWIAFQIHLLVPATLYVPGSNMLQCLQFMFSPIFL